jgi:rod shape-determining protein MreC
MEALLNRYRNVTVLLLVIVAQIVLLAYQVKSNQDVRLIRVWAVTAVTPLARIVEYVRAHTVGFVEDYFVLLRVKNENEKLKSEIGHLKLENQFLKTELSTADRVQALRAFQARTQSRTLASRIIGASTGANSRVVLIDRGTTSGVLKGMAVVTPDGIVGKVLASYPVSSQVLLVTDASFAAGVISQQNRVHGTVKGQGHSTCVVDYVQSEQKVSEGEWFYTSGDDRVFPKGLPVGKVTVVRSGKSSMKEIFLVPSGLQNGLEEVLIILEGVHEAIPELPSSTAQAQLLPAPPAEASGENDSPISTLGTDADRLRERYKRIGEAQGHVFGEGGPGARPPDFNLVPGQPKPGQPKLPSPSQPGASSPTRTDIPAKPADRPAPGTNP